MEAIKNKISTIKTNQLIEIAEGLIKKNTEDADLVFNIVIGELSERLDEKTFVNLCAQMEQLF